MNTMNSKPTCKLVGMDGNVFAIVGTVAACLKRAGLRDQAREFSQKALRAKSYNEVLTLCMEYVDVE